MKESARRFVHADSSLDGLPQDWIYCLSNDQHSTTEQSIAKVDSSISQVRQR
jgi:hypothetical protein